MHGEPDIATGYDRVRPIMDGRVKVEGAEISILSMSRRGMFSRAWNYQDRCHGNRAERIRRGDLARVKVRAYGISPYIAVPAFPSRSFRWFRAFTFGTDRGIKTPMDLKGKRSACPNTRSPRQFGRADIYIDEYGLNVEDMKWVQGGMDDLADGQMAKQFSSRLPDHLPGRRGYAE